MHDAVARWDDVHIAAGRLGPVNEMETVFIPSLFDCAVFSKAFSLRNRRIPPPVSGRRSIGSGRPGSLWQGRRPDQQWHLSNPPDLTSAVWPRMP